MVSFSFLFRVYIAVAKSVKPYSLRGSALAASATAGSVLFCTVVVCHPPNCSGSTARPSGGAAGALLAMARCDSNRQPDKRKLFICSVETRSPLVRLQSGQESFQAACRRV